jgi:hypothetical protein
MTPARFPAMSAITGVRRAAVDVVVRADVIIFASEGEANAALRELPTRVRALISRAQRCLEALETEGIS